jgi:hydrogenase maturation protease
MALTQKKPALPSEDKRWKIVNGAMLCGNPLRGDDAVALHLTRSLREHLAGPKLIVHTLQQWTSELAEPLSRCNLAIFLDASARLSPGSVHCKAVTPFGDENHALLTHSCNPALLRLMSHQLYGRVPKRSYLLTIGAQSFVFSFSLSSAVQRAIPDAFSRINKLLPSTTSHSPALNTLVAS